MAFLSKGIPKIIITEEFTIVLFCFFCYNNDNKVKIFQIMLKLIKGWIIMQKSRWTTREGKRYFIISLSAAYMALPVMADVLSGDATAVLPEIAVACAAPSSAGGLRTTGT